MTRKTRTVTCADTTEQMIIVTEGKYKHSTGGGKREKFIKDALPVYALILKWTANPRLQEVISHLTNFQGLDGHINNTVIPF